MAEPAPAQPNVNARIVYWGAPGSGKTANLRMIHAKLRSDHRGELREVPTRIDPSVSYEMMPIELGEIAGVRTRIQIIAVPGGPEQGPTRKQLLDKVDAVVFVVDAQRDRIDANVACFEELRRALAAYGRALESVPMVIQYNKRDLADPFALEELHRKLDIRGAGAFEAVATEGTGVLQTLTTVSKRVIRARRGQTAEAATASRAPAGPSRGAVSAAVKAALPAQAREAAPPLKAASTPAAVPRPAIRTPATAAVEPPVRPAPAAAAPSRPAAVRPAGPPLRGRPAAELAPAEFAPAELEPEPMGTATVELDAREIARATANTQVALDESWPEVNEIHAEAMAEANAAQPAPLIIASVGRPEANGPRSLVLPLVLKDSAHRRHSLLLTIQLDALLDDADDGG
ncbi:MAG TPA: ADP-ribosylation factor-like protein [Myxococcota bacterium]|nr:ADP-ribosylation factor-like protein [Myxococcota bacterium]